MTEPSSPFIRFFSRRDLPGLENKPMKESANAEERAAIAAEFGLLALDRLDVEARLQREGAEGWRLEGDIIAKATQACVVTLDPVEAEIREPFIRSYRPMSDEEVEAFEAEALLDPFGEDPPEPLGAGIDLGAAALESLALGLDPYPRAPGATFSTQVATPPGADPLTDEAVRPFAALEALKSRAGDDQ